MYAQMVRRLNSVPSFMGRPYGSHHLHPPSSFRTPTALHSRLLWLYRIDIILCRWRTFFPYSQYSLDDMLMSRTQLQKSFLTLFAAIFQLVALLWYLVSYFPLGSTGLQFMGRFGVQRIAAWVSG